MSASFKPNFMKFISKPLAIVHVVDNTPRELLTCRGKLVYLIFSLRQPVLFVKSAIVVKNPLGRIYFISDISCVSYII